MIDPDRAEARRSVRHDSPRPSALPSTSRSVFVFLCLLLSSFLSGLSGMSVQVLFLSSAGLALGYGGSTALGLAAYLAGWALGAFFSRRFTANLTRAFLILGAAAFLL